MKISYVTLFLLFQSLAPLCGQSWFTGNPRWTNQLYGGMGGLSIEDITITGDTILDGKTAKVFSQHRVANFGGPGYYRTRVAYQSGDTIWAWSNGEFNIMYNFSLVPGDTLFMKMALIPTNSLLKFVIDSVGLVEISGILLRFQKVRFLFSFSTSIYTNTIIEKIGMVNGTWRHPPSPSIGAWPDHFFADETGLGWSDYPIWTFCNYTNDSLIYEDLTGGCAPLSPACDVQIQIIQGTNCLLPMVVSTGQILQPCNAPDSLLNLPLGSFANISYYPISCNNTCGQGAPVNILCLDGVTNTHPGLAKPSVEVMLYPNPASSEVFIENFLPEDILIIDALGAVVKTISSQDKSRFSVEGLSSGAYFVKMSNRKKVVIKKILVE